MWFISIHNGPVYTEGVHRLQEGAANYVSAISDIVPQYIWQIYGRKKCLGCGCLNSVGSKYYFFFFEGGGEMVTPKNKDKPQLTCGSIFVWVRGFDQSHFIYEWERAETHVVALQENTLIKLLYCTQGMIKKDLWHHI